MITVSYSPDMKLVHVIMFDPITDRTSEVYEFPVTKDDQGLVANTLYATHGDKPYQNDNDPGLRPSWLKLLLAVLRAEYDAEQTLGSPSVLKWLNKQIDPLMLNLDLDNLAIYHKEYLGWLTQH